MTVVIAVLVEPTIDVRVDSTVFDKTVVAVPGLAAVTSEAVRVVVVEVSINILYHMV